MVGLSRDCQRIVNMEQSLITAFYIKIRKVGLFLYDTTESEISLLDLKEMCKDFRALSQNN